MFCIWFLIRIFPIHRIDNGVQNSARLHEFHVVIGGARRARAGRGSEHGCGLAAHLLAGVARLHEGRRLVLLRQDEGGDGRDGRAADDDAADDFLVGFRDLPELAEVNAFFFL